VDVDVGVNVNFDGDVNVEVVATIDALTRTELLIRGTS
jgi:hypothetical protein